MTDIRNNTDGFTIIEILIAMVISGVAITAMYSVYNSQQKIHVSQQQIVEMQQNLRSGELMLVNEIRMAGYDPTGEAGAGIVNLGSDTITFTMDLDGDGTLTGSDENITYLLYTDSDGRQKLGRQSPTTPQAVAENIDALNFVYLDEDGNVTASASAVRSIQVSLVARTDRGALDKHVDHTTYKNMMGVPIYTAGGDSFRRRLLATQIKCRNLSL